MSKVERINIPEKFLRSFPAYKLRKVANMKKMSSPFGFKIANKDTSMRARIILKSRKLRR